MKTSQSIGFSPKPLVSKDALPGDFVPKRVQRAEDGKKAMAEYEAEARAIRIKTEKLKALRLAKEAAVPAAPPKKVAAKAKPKAKAKKAKEAPLSDWLKDQQGSGRNN